MAILVTGKEMPQNAVPNTNKSINRNRLFIPLFQGLLYHNVRLHIVPQLKDMLVEW